MKKIILSFVMVGVTSWFAYSATSAYFSDVETSTGNTFSAGTLDLNLDGGNTNVVKFSLSNLKPGDTGGGTWTAYNSGSISGYLDLHTITRVDDDNNCTEPESTDGDTTCGPSGGGELSANTNVDLFVDANNNGVYDAGETTIYSGLLSGLAADYDQNVGLAAGGTNYIRLNWGIPTTTGNVIQSDGVTLGMTFELGQTTGQ